MSKALYEPATIRYSVGQIYRILACTGKSGSLEASLEDVQRAFGRSHMPPSGDGKVAVEYVFRNTRTGELITLYSYKGAGERSGYWSIGGHGHPVVFADWVKKTIAAYRRRARKLADYAAARAAEELDATLAAAC